MKAIGVCLIHAYANDAHERRVAEINASGTLPDGLRIVPYYNRSEIIERAAAETTAAETTAALA